MIAQSSFTPLQWKNGVDPTNKSGFQNFMKQLADWANNQLTQTVSLQNQINAQALAIGSPKSQAFGSVSTGQSFDCTGANGVVLSLTITTSLSLTLNHLGFGIPVWVVMSSPGGNLVFSLAANTPAAVAYTVTAINTTGSGAFNLGTGFTTASSAATYMFSGNSLSAGPNLYLSLT